MTSGEWLEEKRKPYAIRDKKHALLSGNRSDM